MSTKLRKQSEKLLFINWKLREQLHQAKEKIEELESESSKFYTAVVYLRDSQTRQVIFSYSKTYPTLEQARSILDFFKHGIGISYCERRFFIATYYGTIIEQYVSEKFYPKESEVNSD